MCCSFKLWLRQRTCRDVDQSEQSHPSVSAHCPLLGLTVGLTAVVHEASLVPLWPGVNDTVLTHTHMYHTLAVNSYLIEHVLIVSINTMCLLADQLYLVQSQHIEVTDVVLLSVSDPGPALLLVNHLPNVFAHKLTLGAQQRRQRSLCILTSLLSQQLLHHTLVLHQLMWRH